MKLRKISLTIIFAFAALALFVAAAQAQDKPKDNVIITVGLLDSRYSALFDLGAENRQGVTGAANVRIVGNKTRLGGKFRFDQVAETRRYLFGPEVGHTFKFFTPYGHALFGFEDAYRASSDRRVARLYGGGVRFKAGPHLVLNPFQYDAVFTEGPGQKRVDQVSASIGIAF
jgi:hypothetical protein